MFGCKTDVTSSLHTPKEFGAVFMCGVSQDPGDIQFPIQTQAIEKAERQIFVDFSSVLCPNL